MAGAPSRARRGRSAPNVKSCSSHSCASVYLANSVATPIIRAAPDDAKKHLSLDFWGSNPTPQSQDTWVLHTHLPATWLPAMLAWDLSHFWGTEGPGKPHASSVGTLCYHRGLCACWRTWQSHQPPQAPRSLGPPSQAQPTSHSALAPGLTVVTAAAADALALSMSKCRPWAGDVGGRAAAPASSASRLCARPKQSPFLASPSPSPLPCRSARGGWDPLPALSQGGEPPAHRCHRPYAIRRVPLIRDGEKLSQALSRLALL